ncbi:MAG: hypothetical protein EB107_01670 [Proteobacteria bacterium]|nr:hypothetical protein [Pseudomonadota bacterium]
MGRPTWILLGDTPEWRWGTDGDECAWYPSARLYRRNEGEPWLKTVDRVACDIAEIVGYLGPGNLDYSLINTGVPAAHVIERHRRDGLNLLTLSAEELRKINDFGVEVVATNLIEDASESRSLWNKVDTVRHDPTRVGLELAGLVAAVAAVRASAAQVVRGAAETGFSPSQA